MNLPVLECSVVVSGQFELNTWCNSRISTLPKLKERYNHFKGKHDIVHVHAYMLCTESVCFSSCNLLGRLLARPIADGFAQITARVTLSKCTIWITLQDIVRIL